MMDRQETSENEKTIDKTFDQHEHFSLLGHASVTRDPMLSRSFFSWVEQCSTPQLYVWKSLNLEVGLIFSQSLLPQAKATAVDWVGELFNILLQRSIRSKNIVGHLDQFLIDPVELDFSDLDRYFQSVKTQEMSSSMVKVRGNEFEGDAVFYRIQRVSEAHLV